MGLVLLMWIKIFRPLAEFGNCSSRPPGPESGRCPISRAVLVLRPVWISSSSLQKVPSIKTRSAEAADLVHSEFSPERDGAKKKLFDLFSNRKPMEASSDESSRRHSSLT